MANPETFTVRYLGGPSALLDYGGVTILVDPTFDPPGDYPIGERVLTKTAGPALSAEEVDAVDVVLLSHDQHPDNLDRAGRDYVDTARLVLSTRSAEDRLGGAVLGLPNWVSQEFDRPSGGTALVTGVPALHGPEGSEPVVGEVTGFVLTGEGLPTVYVSGDNASLDLVREIAARYAPVDVALLFAGGARTPLLDFAYLTLTSAEAAQAATILRAGAVVPLHFEQWAHFSEGGEQLQAAFAAAGQSDQLHLLKPGETASF
ncbi:MBL fold metallo-hydrolase [Catenulispora sp. NF23]|uniref:MBL fold metallo-hydrolase n=1 Tax=Catenulispora pinistramenti TaxID=2705254 RepID=A0ABS5L5D7_9ACTN|nr:MBL fold metallo-hydrolase [Catenulispora pinistramenti]MBS2536588.1 MBL fold metallo-hydrolase [Catenulispora pinistramenti]MBS2553429.1 MBL fold metallo-hydrolase [Catenulispora pinistramenti]